MRRALHRGWVVVAVGVLAVVVAGGGGGLVGAGRGAGAAEPGTADEPQPGWREAFDKAYSLREGEIVKFLPPPFIPERALYFRHEYGANAGDSTDGWSFVLVVDGAGKRALRSISSDAGTVDRPLPLLGIESMEMEVAEDLRTTPAPGDWVIRKGADPAALLAEIAEVLRERHDRRVKVERVKVRKDVLVARGGYRFVAGAFAKAGDKAVHLFAEPEAPADTDGRMGGGSGGFAEFLINVGERAGLKVIDETTSKPKRVSYAFHRSAPSPAKPAAREGLIKNLAAQTSLRFTVEEREVQVWRITDEGAPVGL